jgi:hypothetical protein
MKNIYTKYFWDEERVTFFSHFRDDFAVRQIEIWKDKTLYLSEENPNQEGSMLYDGRFDELDLTDTEFISQEEFEKVWNQQNNAEM